MRPTVNSDIDLHLGRRILRRRRMLGLTQGQLGALVGVTHQSMQKYESGVVRISAPMIWALSLAMAVPVTYFYEGLEKLEESGEQKAKAKGADRHGAPEGRPRNP
jgi:transcriptional regulator with XRE-family HTH domain